MDKTINATVFSAEEFSPYEKTIYYLAISTSLIKSYPIAIDDIGIISSLLKVDDTLLNKALDMYSGEALPFYVAFGKDIIEINDSSSADLFYGILQAVWIYKALNHLSLSTEKEAIIENYRCFNYCIDRFNMLNSFSSVFESVSQNLFSLEYSVFGNNTFSPAELIKTIETILLCEVDEAKNVLTNESDYIYNCLPILYRSFEFEIKTRVHTVYLILSTQIIKHSIFFNGTIKQIANEMYEHLLGMLQNAWLIAAQVELLPMQYSDIPEKRTRKGRTTRIQLLYGYPNYDSYCIRLDLKHKGQGFVHYNNKSPSGVNSYFFSQNRLQSIIHEYPEAKDFFIKYGNLYALKEPNGLSFSKSKKKLFESIMKDNEHFKAFYNDYSESDIIEFSELVAKLLPSCCFTTIDTEEIFATMCFQYSKLMTYILLVGVYSITNNHKLLQKLLNRIAEKAAKISLISENEIKKYNTVVGAYCIMEEIIEQLPFPRI